MKDFFSKHDQIRKKLGIWSHLLKKYLMENFIFCALSTFSYEAIQTVIKVLENGKIFKFLNLKIGVAQLQLFVCKYYAKIYEFLA